MAGLAGAATKRRQGQLRSFLRHEELSVKMALARALHHSAPRVEVPRERSTSSTTAHGHRSDLSRGRGRRLLPRCPSRTWGQPRCPGAAARGVVDGWRRRHHPPVPPQARHRHAEGVGEEEEQKEAKIRAHLHAIHSSSWYQEKEEKRRKKKRKMKKLPKTSSSARRRRQQWHVPDWCSWWYAGRAVFLLSFNNQDPRVRAPCIQQSLVRCLVCLKSSGFGFWRWLHGQLVYSAFLVRQWMCSRVFYGAFDAISHIFYVKVDFVSCAPRRLEEYRKIGWTGR